MEEMRNAYTILVGSIKIIRPLWKLTLSMNLMEIG
jgi:hypothetical protein